MKISLDVFDQKSIDKAIRELETYSRSLDRKSQELCERLAEKGVMYAEWNFSGVQWTYSGEVDYTIDVRQEDENHYLVVVNGEGVLFLEFGAGVKLGSGHPMASEMGMGPGTYPNGKGHWDDPNGWWYRDGKLKIHTYGNAPGMPMYNAAKDLRSEIQKVAQEVFKSND